MRRAAEDGEEDRLRQSIEFLDFFEKDTLEHFREEEEIVFPLAIGDERAAPLLGRVVMEHLQIHALVSRLSAEVVDGRTTRKSATELAVALEAHVRLEEGELFPLLEEVVPGDQLLAISLKLAQRSRTAPQKGSIASRRLDSVAVR